MYRLLKMRWPIFAIFWTFLVAGNHRAAAQDKNSPLGASDVQGLLSAQQGLDLGGIAISEANDKRTSYNEARDRQVQRGSESQAAVSSAGAGYLESAHEGVNAQDHTRKAQAHQRDSKVTAGSVGYRRQQEHLSDEEERRKLASSRGHVAGAYTSASGAVAASHRDTEALSAEEERRRREKSKDRTQWTAGSSVSITHDKDKQSEEELRRKAQLARESSGVHSGSGAVHSSSTKLSQEELQRKLKALNETKDLRAGQARLVHKKYKGAKSEREQDFRKSQGKQSALGYSGVAEHSEDAHSDKDRRENSHGHEETVELSAGKQVGLKESLGGGHTDKYGSQHQKARESTAVAGVGTGRLQINKNAESGSEAISRGDQSYHDVGVQLRERP